MHTLALLATIVFIGAVQIAAAQDLMGICAGDRGPQQAIEACSRLIQTSPAHFAYRSDMYFNRGIARANLDDLDGAIADFTRALQDNPNSAHAYNNRGMMYAQKGQLNAARSDLENALAINPNLSKARENLDKINNQIWNSGRPSTARTAVDAASLVDEWETRSSVIGHRYTFRSNGTYVYTIFQVVVGGTREAKTVTGTYRVQGDQLILAERGGTTITYRWSIGKDDIIPESRIRVLTLVGPQGTQKFYGSSN